MNIVLLGLCTLSMPCEEIKERVDKMNRKAEQATTEVKKEYILKVEAKKNFGRIQKLEGWVSSVKKGENIIITISSAASGRKMEELDTYIVTVVTDDSFLTFETSDQKAVMLDIEDRVRIFARMSTIDLSLGFCKIELDPVDKIIWLGKPKVSLIKKPTKEKPQDTAKCGTDSDGVWSCH